MKKILLVDDEGDLINYIASILQEEGFDVSTRLSAEEALGNLASDKPDLVISDVRMQQMDGFTMLEKMKTMKGYSNVPVIFLTAMDDRLGQQQASKLGAAAYISKPFDLDDLVGLVKKVLPPV
ncbi:MAG: response regulator [Ignavibacteriales bacterium]|nr:response regulator [Ignavibacteriales bacterium]